MEEKSEGGVCVQAFMLLFVAAFAVLCAVILKTGLVESGKVFKNIGVSNSQCTQVLSGALPSRDQPMRRNPSVRLKVGKNGKTLL